MLSHLRFHRRGPSNPNSPAAEQSSPSSLNSHQQSPLNSDSVSPLDTQLSSSASNSLPPTLPPITRVTSTELNFEPLEEKRDGEKQPQTVNRPPHVQRSGYSNGSGFIGGVALRNYQRNVEAQQVDGHAQALYPTPLSNNANLSSRPAPQASGSSKGNLPYSSSSNQWLSGSRLAGESPSSSGVLNIEPQKGKKGLPFLKNPMSTLLLRRRNNQNLPNALPLPLDSRLEDPTYDPRIKGTRVHDFSAPRRRTNAPATDTVAIRSASLANIALGSGVGPHDGAEARGSTVLDGQLQRRMLSSASDPARPESGSTNSHTIAQSSSVSSVRTGSSTAEQAFPIDDNVITGLIMKGNDPALQATPSVASQASTQEMDHPANNTGSIRTTRSRNVSLSSVPRHMKSTSSRFSFDMIGAAKQEKLLEERHRQRELDKKAAEDEPRDSRFDDFDEDAFDYDAMMDDDGLEEKIPGINADYDDEEEPYLDDQYYEQQAQYVEDEIDPGDDQENFAGFTFQRSIPTSSLATPQIGGTMPTPRDADGEVIGCAVTKDTPGLSNISSSPEPGPAPDQEANRGPGLGIHGVDTVSASFQTLGLEAASVPAPTNMPSSMGTRRGTSDDDLYFDEGMASFGGVFAEDLAGSPVDDGVPFDESIFDNDDTDQYGRPLPGAFALAKTARETNNQDCPEQETEEQEPELIPQQLPEQLPVTQSAIQASTSISSEHSSENAGAEVLDNLLPLSEATIVAPQPTAYNTNPIAAYQAALAAAAQKAQECGQFERAEAQSPTDTNNKGQAPNTNFDESDALRDYEHDDYGYSYDDMDDFEMDDDAIIAEANASALANDSDGWYGQEFGFYAAPVSNHGPSSNFEDTAYVAGGFFGPKGASNLNRSASGRVVSREPNLTPITERSEYSNRNSLMSLGMPPISGTPIVQSPGLAQLAMMADRGDDQMNFTALLRLRSKAWGSSQVSLSSSKDGSPRSERGEAPGSPRGPGFPGGIPPSTASHTRKNSVFSIVSRDSEGSVPASPTLIMPTSALVHSSSFEPHYTNRGVDMASARDVISISPIQIGSNILQEGVSPLSDPLYPSGFMVANAHPHAMGSSQDAPIPEKGHQRQKGSTDSISYMMEEESGETRWVMERRRTGESGQVEILEREVVEGGRI